MKIKAMLAIALALLLALSFCFISASAESDAESAYLSEPSEDTVGGISITAWVIIFVLFALLLLYATYSVKFKKK